MESLFGLLHQGTSVVIPFIVLLGVLIFVHELGHFSVAKFFGVRVETFSLGFGRKILKKKWGDTTYCISIIPFGGYVKMYGDEANADIPTSEQKYSFNHQRVLPRIAIVLAGPTMNALFAFFLFTVISGVGEESLKPKLGDIYPNTAAYEIGFRTDDVITKINDRETDRWDAIKKVIEENNDKPLTFVVRHDDKTLILHGTPKTVPNKNILVSKAFVGEIEGLNYLSRGPAIGISDPLSPAARAGLKTNDIIHKVNGQEINRWVDLEITLRALAQKGEPVTVEIERGSQKDLNFKLEVENSNAMAGIEPSDLYLSSVLPKSAADAAGIQTGDKLISINGEKLQRWDDVIRNVQSFKDKQTPLEVVYSRDGKTNQTTVSPRLITQTDATGVEQKNYALGIVTGLVYAAPETFIAKEPNLGAMISRGFENSVRWTVLTAVSFVKLAQGKVSSKSIGGPLMIGKLASDTWRIGLSPFLRIMAIISINLFILNLLPVPVLDGGHLLFFFIELFKGAPLSLRKMEIMQQVGLFLLLALMAYSMFNDIVRFFTAS